MRTRCARGFRRTARAAVLAYQAHLQHGISWRRQTFSGKEGGRNMTTFWAVVMVMTDEHLVAETCRIYRRFMQPVTVYNNSAICV